MNRRKILRMSTSFLPLLLGRDTRHLYEITSDGLPPDTRVVNVRMSSNFVNLEFLLESDEFEEVPDGIEYPEIEPKFTTIRLPEHSTSEASPN